MSGISKIIDNLFSDEIYEMAKVCEIEPKVEVFVNTNDNGNIPHFHVWKKIRGRLHEWEVCVRYDSAEYFSHKKHPGTMPSDMTKKLNEVLKKKNPNSRHGDTYWQTAVEMWNQNNERKPLDWDLEQPDYTKLNK